MKKYPRARYHAATGQMCKVLSPEEEADLGPMWGDAQTDVRYPKNPPPIREKPPVSPPVFSVKLPQVKNGPNPISEDALSP